MSVRILSANLKAPEFIALIDTHAELMLSLSHPAVVTFYPWKGSKTLR